MSQTILRLNGEQVIPLSKVVKEFALKQGNLKETMVFQQLVYARWAWKELFRRNIWGIKNVVIPVDCKTHQFTIPQDCERIINISVVDQLGKIQPLTEDPNISTVIEECVKPNCTCQKCKGKGTLCGAIDSVKYTTEQVEIQGQFYTKQIWVRYDGNGAIQQEEKIPTLNSSNNQITYTTNISTICNVETTTEGCIKATTTNMELLRTWVGCGSFPDGKCGIAFAWMWGDVNLIPQPYNYFGYWNVNAADPSIIHIFRTETKFVPKNDPHGIYKVIVSYQPNGEQVDDEILIPEYAAFAVQAGMLWQQKFFNPRASASDKEYAKREWNAAVVKVNKHLNPVRLEVLAKLQTNPRRW